MKRVFSIGLAILGLLLGGGCASYDHHVASERGLDGVKKFFVLSNQNDNHGLDHQLAAAFKIRGNEAEVGPLTMLPDDSQVVISYEDRWEWDFGDHLAYLQIIARDRRTGNPLATVRFSAKIPKLKTTPVVVGELVDRLLADRKP